VHRFRSARPAAAPAIEPVLFNAWDSPVQGTIQPGTLQAPHHQSDVGAWNELDEDVVSDPHADRSYHDDSRLNHPHRDDDRHDPIHYAHEYMCMATVVPITPNVVWGEAARSDSLVDCLSYLVLYTRLDVAYAYHNLPRLENSPEKAHCVAARRVLRYLKGRIIHMVPTASADQLADMMTKAVQKLLLRRHEQLLLWDGLHGCPVFTQK
jgi:hypothetical protein